MTKISVGEAGGLIDRLIVRMGYPTSSTLTDAQRLDCLRALNEAERYVSQTDVGSLYLSMRIPLQLNSGLASAAIPAGPPAIDFGKDVVIETSDGFSTLRFMPADEFAAVAAPSYDAINITAPSFYTIALDADFLTPKFFFKPANTSGGNIQYTLTCQRAVSALTDSNTSFSMLPEGYELTILLDRAESQLKRVDDQPGWLQLEASAEAQIQKFYGAYRTNKVTPTTDTGKQHRKIEEDQLAEGR